MSKTDWERVRKIAASNAPIPFDPEDGPYDPNDEAATEALFNDAIGRGPLQRANATGTVRLDLADEVIEYFAAQGGDWHEQINATLKTYIHEHRLAKAS